MFPTGTAGAGLWVLRISVATTLVVDGTARGTLVTTFWILILYAVVAACLCIGVMTPYAASLCCLLELGTLILTKGENEFHLLIAIVTSGVLAVMGPGAYSIDSVLFGRRLLSLPPIRKHDAD